MKKISLIVPVYNCAPYVRTMASSVLGQDYPDFEVIFSDDGSSDDSPGMLRALDDPRVRIVEGENRGVSAARNRALAIASGDYIGFADADDVLEAGYLSALAGRLDRGADMACCGFTRAYESGTTDFLPAAGFSEETTDRDGMAKNLLRPDGYTTVVWNKLFTRAALTDGDGSLLRFDETLHIVEDGEFIFRAKIRTAAFFPGHFYRYVVRRSGAMYAEKITKRRLSELDARKKIIGLTEDLSPETQALARMKYQKGVRDLMFHAVISGDGDKVRSLRPELRVYRSDLFQSPYLTDREKLKYRIYRPLIQMNLRRVGAFLMDKLSGH